MGTAFGRRTIDPDIGRVALASGRSSRRLLATGSAACRAQSYHQTERADVARDQRAASDVDAWQKKRTKRKQI
ncbi:hypothetical protein PWG15_09825 [Ensifer adhaerens]|uniref:hypothetical protein n=1 Tax=Ensifer adhaerens TaxID=106592 RepID=UPI0023A99985|nr:hypothetical protein [Ensifer adhaerens]WDZ78760.1 hypothetical protein PWG15_09825 [Ensifer adhaerens]